MGRVEHDPGLRTFGARRTLVRHLLDEPLDRGNGLIHRLVEPTVKTNALGELDRADRRLAEAVAGHDFGWHRRGRSPDRSSRSQVARLDSGRISRQLARMRDAGGRFRHGHQPCFDRRGRLKRCLGAGDGGDTQRETARESHQHSLRVCIRAWRYPTWGLRDGQHGERERESAHRQVRWPVQAVGVVSLLHRGNTSVRRIFILLRRGPAASNGTHGLTILRNRDRALKEQHLSSLNDLVQPQRADSGQIARRGAEGRRRARLADRDIGGEKPRRVHPLQRHKRA